MSDTPWREWPEWTEFVAAVHRLNHGQGTEDQVTATASALCAHVRWNQHKAEFDTYQAERIRADAAEARAARLRKRVEAVVSDIYRMDRKEIDDQLRAALADSGPVQPTAREARLEALVTDGIEAFRLTREYVGEYMLPPMPGWSWFDWTERAEAALEGSEGDSLMTDANRGRRIRIQGDERGYRVYSVEPDGHSFELENVNTVTITFHKSGHAEAMVYFSKVELQVEAPRSPDGVRAG